MNYKAFVDPLIPGEQSVAIARRQTASRRPISSSFSPDDEAASRIADTTSSRTRKRRITSSSASSNSAIALTPADEPFGSKWKPKHLFYREIYHRNWQNTSPLSNHQLPVFFEDSRKKQGANTL